MSRLLEETDEALIAKCRQGSEEAWITLVARYERLVYTIPLRYGLPPSEADDVYQTVWLALLRHLPTLKQPKRVSAWLVTTAKRESWNRRRGADFEWSRSTNPHEMPAIDAWIEEALPEAIISRYDTQTRMEKALGKIGEKCRRLLKALYYDPTSPSYQTIAARLDMPVGAIGPNRARCLNKLKEFWVG